MSFIGKDLVQIMDEYAPPMWAVDQDPIGLQVGSLDVKVKGVVVTLDINQEVIDEAVRKGANWIIAHHALIYRPLKTILTDQPSGKLLARILQQELNVFIAHTNLDAAKGGVNDVLAERLGLVEPMTLVPYKEDFLQKLVVFVPIEYRHSVLQAISMAGAGWIGNYSHYSFHTEGIGTFRPEIGARPFVGEVGAVEQVQEVRLETVVPQNKLQAVLEAMHQAHPYEEVAYDLYPLNLPGEEIGFGKIGKITESITLQDLAERVKKVYHVKGVRVVGNLDKPIQQVAVLGGSGGGYWLDAKQKGADVLITGDVDYHVAQAAKDNGLCMIDPGHHIEHFVVPQICQVLKTKWGEEVPIFPSEVNTNPFCFL